MAKYIKFFLYISLGCLAIWRLTSCEPSLVYDVVIENGMVYDGSGGAPYRADVGIVGERIAKIGDLSKAQATQRINAQGKAVSPGFINVLSWGAFSLWEDGRSLSDLKQGVTLEIFGEGSSPGPVSPTQQAENPFYEWRTLGEFLEKLTQKGVSCNVASFVGAATVRRYVLGDENSTAKPNELRQMQLLVEQAMKEGALGVGSALIYPPGYFANTEELIALAQAAAKYDGVYISHLRSEGDAFVEGLEELLEIAEKANIAAEIYHLKAAGEHNWHKLDVALQRIEAARARGLEITTNMYTYEAASTGLGACFPPWVQEGGRDKWVARLKDPAIRARVAKEMTEISTEWENFFMAASKPENILLLGFQQDSLQHMVGQNLGAVAQAQGLPAEQMAIELILRNHGNVSCAYVLMSPDNVRRQLKLPYMSFGSDARSVAAEGEVLKSSTHPRTYGNFARLLGKYVREEQVIPLEEAIHKLSHLAATKLRIQERGLLKETYFADVVVFDPALIADKATFENPHQYAVGVEHVLVNGVLVLENGEHTGNFSGKVVRGPGYVPPLQP